MRIQEFLDKGRTLCTLSPDYPPNSYAADLRAMLPKALNALQISYKELRKIEGPQQSFSHGSATAVLAEMQAALEDAR